MADQWNYTDRGRGWMILCRKKIFRGKMRDFFFSITVNTTFVRFILEFERGFKFLFSTWIDQQNGII